MLRLTKTHRLFFAALLATAVALPNTALAGKNLLRLHFRGPVTESPAPENPLAKLFAPGSKARSLRSWVAMIDKAAADPAVHGALMLVDGPEVGLAQVEELNRALKRFKAAGKKIYCYLDHAGNVGYALASAADHITLTEYSTIDIVGLHAELMFFKGMFDKIGIVADMMHSGDYKSALEPFTRTEPSKEAAEQLNWLLDGLFDQFVSILAENRGLSESQIKKLIDAAPLEAADALDGKLVDQVATFPAFKQMIRKEYGKDVKILKKYGKKKDFELDFSNPFALIQQVQELFAGMTAKPTKPGIGVIYIEGAIVTGPSDTSPFGGSTSAGSTTIRAAFEKARAADHIKAVVVRVNSPGGSALASDIIWDAATRCAAEKPLIVSMGRVAGSGGYYVALPGDQIFAEKTTITGSIGVVGGKLVFNGLADWAGLSITEFDRGKHAGLMSMNRTFNDEERKWLREYLDSVYDQFKGRVMESRGKRIKGDLEKLAGGRVYTGSQALEIGLIDKLGGLQDAISAACEKAGLEADCPIYIIPKPKDLAEMILASFMDKEAEDDWEISSGPAIRIGGDPLLNHVMPILRQLAPEQAARVYDALRNLLILNKEHVGVFMAPGFYLR